MHTHRKFAAQTAERAGTVLMRYFGKSTIAVQKGPNDFATQADLASEKVILSAIKKTYPDHRILAEESGYLGNPSSPYTWIIDPLDGTRNFFNRIPIFGVSIALMHDTDIIAGAIHLPISGETISATSGQGLFLGTKRITTPTIPKKPSLMNVALDATEYLSTQKPLAHFPFGRVRGLGATAVELAYIALGRLDGYISLGTRTKIWDTAAGELLVQESGGTTRIAHAEGTIRCVHAGTAAAWPAVQRFVRTLA